MTDNTRLNPGSSGDLISTDSLGGSPEVKVQNVKVQYGASGTATDVEATAPFPVRDFPLDAVSYAGTNLNNDNNVHDINEDLSRDGRKLTLLLTNTYGGGTSDLTLEVSQDDGATWLAAFNIGYLDYSGSPEERFELEGLAIDQVRITEGVASNANYVLYVW